MLGLLSTVLPDELDEFIGLVQNARRRTLGRERCPRADAKDSPQES
jgi:hypothetical protein